MRDNDPLSKVMRQFEAMERNYKRERFWFSIGFLLWVAALIAAMILTLSN